MCRFLNADFELSLRCPVDRTNHDVRFQACPQVRGHSLEVVACDATTDTNSFTCGKICRALLESGHYWQKVYPESAIFTHTQ